MTDINIDEARAELEKERARLETELKAHGNRSEETGDWQGASDNFSDSVADRADSNIVADQIEELANNVPMVEMLEERYRNVQRALEKIEEGTYGTCEVGGEPIAPERLKANPAALTCIEHSDKE